MGHIRETSDDKRDWPFYYSEGLPKDLSDAQWRKAIGNRAWSIVHGAIDNYPCSLCREVGSRLFHGVHDMVNIHLEKRVFFPEDLQFLAEQTALAMKKVQSLNYRRERPRRR